MELNENLSPELEESEDEPIRRPGPLAEFWGRFFRNRASVLGLVILTLLVLVALFGPCFYDYQTDVVQQNIKNRLQWPSAAHPLGTDEFGRDLLARVVYGTRISLSISFLAVLLGLICGGATGAASGYYGGRMDHIIMRIMDILLAMPMILFAMVIVAALGPKTINLTIALSISLIPSFARVVRGAVLTVRDIEFIEAARATGAKDFHIIMRHVLPNCLAPIIVQTTLRIAATITSIAALSFLGLGVQQPYPEWGSLLSSGRTYIRDSSYLTFFPGLAIMITILALNLLGDGLRDTLDPRLK
ncbi:MAG: ABC transporter permease [Synergistaceae bacterium]|nr:ABC transporter permease [Synergistaceae bacterium]